MTEIPLQKMFLPIILKIIVKYKKKIFQIKFKKYLNCKKKKKIQIKKKKKKKKFSAAAENNVVVIVLVNALRKVMITVKIAIVEKKKK